MTANNGHGGPRPGAGRPPGSGSTATAIDRHRMGEMVREVAPELIAMLLDIALNSPNERNRLTSAIALLDRGYGRPPQMEDIVADDASLLDRAMKEMAGKLRDAMQHPVPKKLMK